MASALDVAAYLIMKSDVDSGDVMTNMKLQKLLYYAQGFSLVLLKNKLFEEPIQAWMHGPVVPTVYRQFKRYRNGVILKEGPGDIAALSDEQKELLDAVYDVYGQYSASKLRNLTHSEPTWQNHCSKLNEEIPTPEMAEFFKNLVEENGQEN